MNLRLPFRDLLKPSLMRIAAILLSAKLKTVMDSSQHSITELLVRVKEAYGAERLIKVSNTYALEPSRFHDLNNEIKDLMLRMTKVSSLAPPSHPAHRHERCRHRAHRRDVSDPGRAHHDG